MSILSRTIPAIICLLWSIAALTPLAAQPLKKISEHSAWRVFTTGNGNAMSCYIVSEPMSKKPSNVKRGEIFLAITHRPGHGVYDEASVRIGYPFSDKSSPFAKIGTDTFTFFTGLKMGGSSASWAWMENTANHDLLVNTMQRGNRLIFKGTSARGTQTTDTYSLIGFTAAYKKLNQICPK